MSVNPLKKYSEKPGTYITLPSGGKYYKTPPKLTADGELEVRPMTAGDELKLKNPDGLMNSDGLFQVIEHIVPGIEHAQEIPIPDLDSIVIGMRIATYGEMMDIGAKCPKCNHKDEYQINLRHVLVGAKKIEAADQVEIGELKINLRPYTAESSTLLSLYQVELARAARSFELAQSTDKESHKKEMLELVKRGSRLIFEIASKHIVSVETPDDGIVTDQKFIEEWLSELIAPEYQIIRDAVAALSEERVDRKMTVTCPNCENKISLEAIFDPANFFGTSSL